jgi:hypothetical protein
MSARSASKKPAQAAAAPVTASRSAHVLLSLATLAVFARALPYPLQISWDDGRLITDNPDVREVSLRSLQSIFGATHFQAYHPLHLLSYWLDVPWTGANPTVLHAVNLALWLIAVNLLLRVFTRLGLSNTAATLAAMACALHPVQVEVVSWATARKDVLALLFSAASLSQHLRSERGTDRHAWLARLFFVFAALSKTTALPLPAVMVACDALLRGRSLRRALAVQALALALALALGVQVTLIWSGENMLRPAAEAGPLLARVAATYAHAIGTLFWPSAVSPLYPTRPVTYDAPMVWLGCAALLVGAILAYTSKARRAQFSLAAFALWMLPVSNVLPMYFLYQDRYLSLPLVGLSFGLGAAVDALRAQGARPGRVAGALAALAVVALGVRSAQYEGAWRSEERLWEHAVRAQPAAYFAWMKLGEVRRKDGQLYGSIRAYQEMLRIDPLRRLGYAALLEVVALRDEALRSLSPSHARALARQFHAALEDADALRTLAARMRRAGYARAWEVPMARSLVVSPLPDNALEYNAASEFNANRPLSALFYLEHMREPTKRDELRERAEYAKRVRGDAPVF